MKFQEFLKKQEEVCGRFRSSSGQIKNEGIKPHGLSGKGGCLIVFKHPDF